MSQRKPKNPTPEERLLAEWLKEARTRTEYGVSEKSWSQEGVVIAINRVHKSEFQRHSVSGWEDATHLSPREVVKWYEAAAFGLEKGYLLELRDRIEPPQPGPEPRDADHSTPEELARFRDWDLEAYWDDLNRSRAVAREWRPALPRLPHLVGTRERLAEVEARVASADETSRDGLPAVVGAIDRGSDEVARYCELVTLVGPRVGLYGGTQGTRRLIAADVKVFWALEQALERRDPVAVQAITALSGYAWLRGRTLEPYAERVIACAADDKQLAGALNAIALSALGVSDHASASKRFDEALGLSAAATRDAATSILGHAELALRRFGEDAPRLFEEARALFVALGDRVGAAHCWLGLAQQALRRGDVDTADDHLVVAVRGYSGLDRLGEVNCVKGFADVAWRRERLDSARDLYTVGLRGYTALDYKLGCAHCLLNLAVLDIACDRPREAQEGIDAAAKAYACIGNELGKANCSAAAGALAVWRAMPDEARAQFTQAQWCYYTLGHMTGGERCSTRIGDLASSVAGGGGRRELEPRDLWAPDDNG